MGCTPMKLGKTGAFILLGIVLAKCNDGVYYCCSGGGDWWWQCCENNDNYNNYNNDGKYDGGRDTHSPTHTILLVCIAAMLGGTVPVIWHAWEIPLHHNIEEQCWTLCVQLTRGWIWIWLPDIHAIVWKGIWNWGDKADIVLTEADRLLKASDGIGSKRWK